MFGRRADGKRLSCIDPIVRVTPYLMPMRCDAQVFLEHQLDYEQLARYIAEKGRQGEKVTFMQILMAAYVRAVAGHPEINRFIMNKQYYARNNCSVSFTMLKDSQNHNSEETVVRLEFDLTDTLFDIRDRMNAEVEKNRNAENGDEFAVKLARFALSLPGLGTVMAIMVRFLDRYGLLPMALLKELPFYSGLYITNNASIGLHHVYHHIYNFGNVGMFWGMGSIRKEAVTDADGKTRMKRWLPVGITADERICSGAHYAAFFADVTKGLNHPETLEVPPEKVIFDQGIEYHVPKLKK